MRYALLISALAGLAACTGNETTAPASYGKMSLSGPFVHENLAIYVVEDPAAKSQGEFITLAEGLASGAVKVTEKKQAQVSELMIENGSDKPCFVQAGDVVKGGQQDRAIGADFVLPPRSGQQPIRSFCVEHGRWHGQAAFAQTTTNVPAKELKLAVQLDKDQGKVWNEVAKYKKGITDTNKLEQSKSSSLNEELENRKIQERRGAFKAALEKIFEGRTQAVGIVTAVNGQVSTSDVYVDPALFRKLLPRLLDSAALEAMATPAKEAKAPSTSEVSAFLAEAERGETREESLTDGQKRVTTENEKSARFKCLYNGVELHKQAASK